MATIEERVAAGADFLDEKHPGWREKIDLETLDISSYCRCVLGQLHGNFDRGEIALGLVTQNVKHLGFDAKHGPCWYRDADFQELTEAWIRELK